MRSVPVRRRPVGVAFDAHRRFGHRQLRQSPVDPLQVGSGDKLCQAFDGPLDEIFVPGIPTAAAGRGIRVPIDRHIGPLPQPVRIVAANRRRHPGQGFAG